MRWESLVFLAQQSKATVVQELPLSLMASLQGKLSELTLATAQLSVSSPPWSCIPLMLLAARSRRTDFYPDLVKTFEGLFETFT